MQYAVLILHDTDGIPTLASYFLERETRELAVADAATAQLRGGVAGDHIHQIVVVDNVTSDDVVFVPIDALRVTLDPTEAKGPRLPLKATLKAKGTVREGDGP